MELESTAYNMPIILQLEGILDIDRLEGTFRKLIQRHESLRTSFLLIQEEAVQKIHGEVEFKIERYDLNAAGTGKKPGHIIQRFVRAFDLSKAPLLRVGLLNITGQTYILMVDMHHIISDGISQALLIENFMTYYQGDELPPLNLQYRDFSGWQWKNLRSDHFKKQEEYWLNRFKGDIPVLDISTDFPRPAVQRFEGYTINSEVEEMLTGKLKAVAAEQGVTLYMILLAIYTLLLSKYTNQTDIIVGSPAAGRRHNDLDSIVGMFINVLLMRNTVDPKKSFGEFLEEVKYNTLQAFENQDYSIDTLSGQLDIKRDASRNPLYEAIFAILNIETRAFAIPGLELKPFQYPHETIKTDLRLGIEEAGEKLITTLTYSTALFKRDTAENMLRDYVEIIEQVVTNKYIKMEDIKISHNLVTLSANVFKEDQEDFNF
jgi:hypothetical protein